MDKVFVVIGSWDYEGYSEPCGVYSTRDKAHEAKEHARAHRNFDDIDILEYDLDRGERERDIATGPK